MEQHREAVNPVLAGGGGGIRTHETLSGLTVFKTAAFNQLCHPSEIHLLIVTYSKV